MRAELHSVVSAYADELVAIRRDIHAHPELGRAEHRTTALVAERLRAAGLQPRLLAGGTGLLCDIGSGPGPVVALRADLDALPVPDAKEVPYRSTVPGVCHACGHDVHTTVVLGAGLTLAAQQDRLPGRARLIFQPAEELTPGGAIGAVDEGALDDVSVIYALHCDPHLEVGKVGLRVGAITSAADMVEIRLRGPGGHTARPHLSVDLVYAAARLVTDLPAGISRLADPRYGMSLVFGSIQSGTAPNVMPQYAEVRGTLRMLDREAWADAPKLVERLVAATVEPYGAQWELEYSRGVPPVCNDEEATGVLSGAVATALGPEGEAGTPQSLGGEDFSWYLEQVPGSLARLGVRSDGQHAELHSSAFNIDERAIGVGVRVLVQTVQDALAAYA